MSIDLVFILCVIMFIYWMMYILPEKLLWLSQITIPSGWFSEGLTVPFIHFTLFIMARVHYGTSRLYDEYADVIDAYVKEAYGPDYLQTIKTELDLTDAQRKYKLLVEVLDHLKPNVVTEMLMETIERPTSVEHHGGDYAPVYAVQDVA